MPPYLEADFEATLAQLDAAGADAGDLDTTFVVAQYWYHSADERCVQALLVLPVHPRYASIVAKMCTRGGHCNRGTLALLLKYADHIVGQTEARRVLHVCASATKFVPDDAVVAMRIMGIVLPHVNSHALDEDAFTVFLDCCGPEYPWSTRCRAASLAAAQPARTCQSHFRDICALAPDCPAALLLLAETDGDWIHDVEKAMHVAGQLMTSQLTITGLDLLASIAGRWPDEAMDNSVLVPLIADDRPLPHALLEDLWIDTHVRNEQHLLVYLSKYGTPPVNGGRLLANVYKYFSVDTRLVYVQELSIGRTTLSLWPPCGSFGEAHAGVTRFVCSDGDCTVLTAHLVRHCLYFKAQESRVPVLKTIARECTTATLEAFRDMLYEDVLPAAAPLVELATFCDIMCNTRHACMCIRELARQDFWAAYDLGKSWAGTRPFIVRAAWDQLDKLVKCSRMAEIADMVAGV